MLGFLPTRAYRPGTPGATTFLSPLSGTFNCGWDSFLTNPSFASYAEDCGAQGLRVERSDQIDGALQAALEHGGPSVIEVIADAALT